MQAYLFHLIAVLLILAGLTVISRFKTRLAAESIESYRNLVGGLFVLSLVALMHLHEAVGSLALIPFVSEIPFFNLISIIGVITGTILLSVGISKWLPLSRTLRYDRAYTERLRMIRNVEQLIGVESRLTEVLNRTLRHMVEQFDLHCGSVFVRSRTSGTMRFLCSHARARDNAAGDGSLSLRLVTTSGGEQCGVEFTGSAGKEPSGPVSRPSAVIPVSIGNRVAAAFTVWAGDRALTHDDTAMLKLAADIVGRRIQADSYRRERERLSRARRLQSRLRAQMGTDELRDKLPALVRVIKSEVPADVCVLTLAYSQNDVRRYTVGDNEALLEEKGVDAAVLRAGRPGARLITGEPDRDPAVGGMIAHLQIKSLLAMPIVDGDNVIGQVLLGAMVEEALDEDDAELLEASAETLRLLTEQEIARVRTRRIEKQMESLAQLAADCAGYHVKLDHLCNSAADMLRREIGVAAVRIATFEDDASFLRSRALVSAHPVQNAVPATGYMIQSLMPVHRKVRETGETIRIDRSSMMQGMSRAEAQQMYQADTMSALLVPIRIRNEVRGIIALAERREPRRFPVGPAEEALVKAVAAVLSLAIRLQESPWGVTSIDLTRMDREKEVRSRIISSLSGILGSIEVLRSHGTGDTENFERYVGIIDRSARRIEACMAGTQASGE